MEPIRFLSLFSGIEAASSAWLPLGWQCAAVAEVDKFCCSLLKRKYPEVPNLGDVTAVTQEQVEAVGPVDVAIFGSPCQDLSVAGKRAGLAGERSGLFFDAMRIVRWSRARYALWENVPGAFSSNAGADFALVLGEMAGIRVDVPDGGWRNTGILLGPSGLVEWAVLDAQWFGVPQRRRRVFVIRDSGDWSSRPPILFDTESLSGNTPPRRKTREDVTGSLAARTRGGGGLGTDLDLGGGGYELSPALTGSGRGTERAGDSRGQDCVIPILEAGARTGVSTDDIRAGSGIGDPGDPGDPMYTLQSGKQHGVFAAFRAAGQDGFSPSEVSPPLCQSDGGGTIPTVFDTTQITSVANYSNPKPGDPCHPLAEAGHAPLLVANVETGQGYWSESDIAATVRKGNLQGHGSDRESMIIASTGHTSHCLNAGGMGRIDYETETLVTHSLRADGFDASEDGTGRGTPLVPWMYQGMRIQGIDEPADTVTTNPNGGTRINPVLAPIAFETRFVRNGRGAPDTVVPPLKAQSGETGKGDAAPCVATRSAVRRLTPRECERLQGFEDEYTTLDGYNSRRTGKYGGNKGIADGPRYKALGNSMAVPVIRHIGERIQLAGVERIGSQNEK